MSSLLLHQTSSFKGFKLQASSTVMAHFGELFHNQPLVILDGGFGTTLETLFHQDVSSPLWSAKPICDNPEIIISAHLAFLRAGARVILTSTYQASFYTFERSGYSRADAERIMLKSVQLAHEARNRFVAERQLEASDVRIALSLGPYGASLFPTQEYEGFYPPPYGPKAFSEGNNCNAFDDGVAAENSVNALAQFHLATLRIFARNPEVWAHIDCIAFESVPLAREVMGIRKAVGMLQKEGNEKYSPVKPWWISLVFPHGRYPETGPSGGQSLSVRQVVEALGENEGPNNPLPSAIGLNCTQTKFFPTLLAELQKAVDDIWDTSKRRPWLVMYPNGNEVYDIASRTWREVAGGNTWANKLAEIVENVMKQGTWGGLVVGGCCRTGPEEISTLYRLLLG